jgi:hypothetical protein
MIVSFRFESRHSRNHETSEKFCIDLSAQRVKTLASFAASLMHSARTRARHLSVVTEVVRFRKSFAAIAACGVSKR